MCAASQLENLRKLAELQELDKQRKRRAADRLVDLPEDHLYVALIGLHFDVDSFAISDAIRIQKVEESPSYFDLLDAFTEERLAEPIGRYSRLINYEIVIGDTQSTYIDLWSFPHYIVITALRIKTLAEFISPAITDYPWASIAGINNKKCFALLWEDVPYNWKIGTNKSISLYELEWVKNNYINLANLLSDNRMFMATESFNHHLHASSLRMSVAALWSGIEAIFGVSTELSFRLSTYIASILEPRGQSRKDVFNFVKKAYDFRSKVIHGGKIPEQNIREHVILVRELLSRILVAIIERGRFIEYSDIEDYVFL